MIGKKQKASKFKIKDIFNSDRKKKQKMPIFKTKDMYTGDF
jgi:hypothetical protein